MGVYNRKEEYHKFVYKGILQDLSIVGNLLFELLTLFFKFEFSWHTGINKY